MGRPTNSFMVLCHKRGGNSCTASLCMSISRLQGRRQIVLDSLADFVFLFLCGMSAGSVIDDQPVPKSQTCPAVTVTRLGLSAL